MIPGVPAAGHISDRGYWHPGSADGCAKCEPPLPVMRSTRGAVRYLNRDKRWRVTDMRLNGVRVFRVECRHPIIPRDRGVRRSGPVATGGGWYWAADLRSEADIEQFVPRADLEIEQ
jgi:hypothetical protein